MVGSGPQHCCRPPRAGRGPDSRSWSSSSRPSADAGNASQSHRRCRGHAWVAGQRRWQGGRCQRTPKSPVVMLFIEPNRLPNICFSPAELGATRVQIRELGADTSPNVGHCLLLVPDREQAEWFESCQLAAISTSGAVASPHSPSRQPGDRSWLLTPIAAVSH